MRKSRIILFVLGIIIGTAVTLAITVNSIGVTQEAWAFDSRSFGTKLTGSTGSGDALIELTPKIDSNRLVVKFNINSHSVRLSQFDLKNITTLEYEGKIRKPIKVSRVGGHHSSGVIVFDVEEDISSFTIRIKGILRVNERIYEWIT